MIFHIVFQVVPFIAALLLYRFFVVPAVRGVRARAIWLMAMLLPASKFVVFAAFGGNAFAPELPEKLIWFWNWAYSGMMILCAFAVSLRILMRIGAKLLRTKPALGGRARLAWLAALPAVAWTLSLVGVWNGVKVPDVEEVALEINGLPPELDGYRIVQLSDVHASAAARAWRTAAIVERVNALDADLVCLTGDYADGLSRNQYANIEPMGALKAKDGVYAVTGNHEFYYDTFGWIVRYNSMRNIRWLNNDCASPRPGLVVGGVNDPVAAHFGFTVPDPDAAFASAADGAFRILLQHRPHVDYETLLGRKPSARVDLQLSGHTHGGVAPGMTLLVSLFNGGMVRGLYPADGGPGVHVSTGAGQWAGFPIRFLDDPTITLFTLRRGRGD